MTGPGSPWPRSLIDPVRLRGQVAADPCVRCGADTGPAFALLGTWEPAEVGKTDRPQRTPQAPQGTRGRTRVLFTAAALGGPCWRALCDWLGGAAERA